MIFEELKPKSNQTIKDASDLILYTSAQTKDDVARLAKYAAGQTKQEELSSPISQFICANEIYSIPDGAETNARDVDWSEAIEELQNAHKLNKNTKQHFRHFVISLDVNESLNKTQWAKIANTLMKKLGYENAKYITFKHSDSDNEHIHIACSVVDVVSRKIINNWQNYNKAQKVMRFFEKKYNLNQIESSADKNKGYDNKINNANKHSLKHMMRRKIETAILSLTHKHVSLPQLEQALLHNGIQIELTKDKTNNRFRGITYIFADIRFAGSALKSGNKFSLGGLVKNGVMAKSALEVNNYQDSPTEEIERFELVRKLSTEKLATLEEITSKRRTEAKENDELFFNAVTLKNNKARMLRLLEGNRLYKEYLRHAKLRRKSFEERATNQLVLELESSLTRNSTLSFKLLYCLLQTLIEAIERTGMNADFELVYEKFGGEFKPMNLGLDIRS
ncbi:relaxase/mobilization nuclease domain-containing protein [Vibrio coralliirubri]|uniref:relaxase/mobilization nuclease domain-containing protein n=1 Tax=Vibrio coralliirubri TaxID=1516159 RepID=UPI00076A1709|nr:relaxase/mobilization nuclease domain-containing protein [Vibrio coralliirubri]